ncbi:branched-chain amino acid transport system II carrier protein [Volucribacter amazonae]|uniref:Branched-chain amino acid transport system carrier protein n=1 Tax=Volucribacter amazonae TaxID=256731 RepID=A0A9X4SL91_9PAST|nr:branched-chain amino acid transport system II carrier protein [Volucribacter amazonae]MDG6895919.1 branched-chain amino acid transporter [Volucribacter amazonae]
MLSGKDILILGMMIFALFLGAGNIIFPPMEGFLAGKNWLISASGFVLTGVLMPFITLVVVTLIGRGEVLSHDLPKWVEIAFWVILYLVIGSTFAMPRVTNVAYEMGWQPLNLTEQSHYNHFIFAAIFNIIGMFFMLKRSTIITSVGKYMTPALLILLIVVAIGVITAPLSDIVAPNTSHADGKAFSAGLISGYQTMDVLAATAFGGIVARALAAKGVSDKKKIFKYTLIAGLISVLLLTGLYFSLFYLGATSQQVAFNATNGGQIFSRYIDVLFGTYGVWIMSGIVILANMTTLVGVTSACADYFSKFSTRLTYPFWVVVFTIMTTIISETGLDNLLRITIPALLLIYPVAIMLVVLQLLRPYLPSLKLSYNFVIGITFVFSAIDALNHLGIIPESINQHLGQLPLYDNGLAWLIPAFGVLLLTFIVGKFTTK